MVGYIVVIQDCNLPHGQWKLGMVIKTFPGIDKKKGCRIEIQYKNMNSDTFLKIECAVQKVAVILPVENKIPDQ